MIESNKEVPEAAQEIMMLLETRVMEGALTDFTATVAVLEAAMAWIIAVAPAGLEARGLDLGATHMAERTQQFKERGYLDEIAKHKMTGVEQTRLAVRALKERMRRGGL
jgi:hypothetical protein